MLCCMHSMDSFSLVIFGITSNLAQIKLIPVLYDMEEKGILDKGMHIYGTARSPMSKEEFKNYFYKILHAQNIHHQHEIKEEVFERLSQKIHYLNASLDDPNLYRKLQEYLDKSGTHNIMYYLATYPDLYHYVFQNLQKLGMNKQSFSASKQNFPISKQKKTWVRLMIEKPIGNDLKSAVELNKLLLNYFAEDQIFRLDHYLGKETLQNILTFRFSNGVFEPLINKEYIDHIQITAAENFGIAKRGGYYDQVGALKDVGQNHQLQMLAFATMDAPSQFSNKDIIAQRIKILKALKPLSNKVVFGQYEGYRQKEYVDPNSNTDTFYAFKTYIQNERFKDVPIYVRAGKKLTQTVTEISIIFKTPVNRLFRNMDGTDQPNVLIYRIQPNEGIVLKMLTKVPGHDIKLKEEYMQYCYRVDPFSHYIPDPYERLIIDAMRGDKTFFNDAQEVEAQWAFIDPLAKMRKKPIPYIPGTWGPKEADKLIEEDGRAWLEPSMDFCRI